MARGFTLAPCSLSPALTQKPSNEGTNRNDRPSFGFGAIDDSRDERRGEPAASRLARHFRVRQHEFAGLSDVADEGHTVVKVHFEAMRFDIVAH
jgi:hypothetical protein